MGALEKLRVALVALVYIVILFLTALCIYINLIFGIKFTVDKQHNWVLTTYLAILLDWDVYSSSKIVLEWLLPPYVTECFFALCCGSILLFGYFWRNYGVTRTLGAVFQHHFDVLPF